LHTNLLQSYKGIDWAKEEADKIDHLLNHLYFAEQKEALGYGQAVFCAREFVNNEPFLLLLGDYLYVSHLAGKRCAQQLIDLAISENCSVSAVNPTVEHLIGRYGTLTGKHMPNRAGVYLIEKLIEKPSLSIAELELQTPGLRIGYYLCFFGMHVLTPVIFQILEKHMQANPKANTLLTPALQELTLQDKYLALEVKGNRYDISKKYGLLQAQISLGLAGKAHDQTLTTIVESLAEANRHTHK
jgi:UTP--glucose-1-phosphate uridylyltransferase